MEKRGLTRGDMAELVKGTKLIWHDQGRGLMVPCVFMGQTKMGLVRVKESSWGFERTTALYMNNLYFAEEVTS